MTSKLCLFIFIANVLATEEIKIRQTKRQKIVNEKRDASFKSDRMSTDDSMKIRFSQMQFWKFESI